MKSIKTICASILCCKIQFQVNCGKEVYFFKSDTYSGVLLDELGNLHSLQGVFEHVLNVELIVSSKEQVLSHKRYACRT